MAQELAYIYGYKDIFNSNGDLTEEGQTQLILSLGIMFGVQGAGAVLRVMAQNAAKYVSKKILTSALTKTWWYPLLKEISKVVATKTLTKKGLAGIAEKAVPLVGGLVSGLVTFASMAPAAEQLKTELAKGLHYTQDIFDADFKEISKMTDQTDTPSETDLDNDESAD
ncbi:hypothetical protein C6P11_10060 [Weissella confusa]|uniref:ABC transporter ATPase n=1 Tax=Weissella confusa TaxID=1583 RepID=A0A4Z0RTX6_WEICO|nr:hypothetical protein C6P11_10060 [Weissella confusa]